MRGWSLSPTPCYQRWLTCALCQWSQICYAAQMKFGPILSSAAAEEKLSQLPYLPQVTRADTGRLSFPLPCHHMVDKRDGTSSFTLTPLELARYFSLFHMNRVSCIALSRQGVGTVLLSVAAGKWQDQFSLVLQPITGGANPVQSYTLGFGGNRNHESAQSHGYGRAMDTNIGLVSKQCPHITRATGGKQATYLAFS